MGSQVRGEHCGPLSDVSLDGFSAVLDLALGRTEEEREEERVAQAEVPSAGEVWQGSPAKDS